MGGIEFSSYTDLLVTACEHYTNHFQNLMHIHLTGHVIAFELYLSSNSEGLWCLAGLGCFHLLGPGTVTQDLLGIVSLLMAIVNDT